MSAKQFVLLLAASFSAMAGPVTIVSVSSGTAIPGVDQLGYVSWTQTGTFTGVTIQAELQDDPAGTDGTGVAYLMSSVGPSATVANEAVTPFNIDITNTAAALVTLFSISGVGPGTYYLVINPTDAQLNWDTQSATQTVTLATGVTLNPAGQLFSGTVPSFPPSAAFDTKDNAFLFSVTGTAAASGVPEPATAGLMLAALVIGALLLRKR